jgi:hypothetical protein
MDDDYFTNNIQSNNLINPVNGASNEKSNNEILLRSIEEHMQNTSQYFNNQVLSDIIINMNQKRFYAHKFILCKSSDVFYTMLMKKHWINSTKKLKNDNDEASSSNSNENLIDEITLVESEECTKVFEK